jgi:hypothetical protein
MGQPMGQYGAGRPRLGFPSVLLAALLESEASRNPVRPVRHGLELPIEAGRSTDGLFTDRFLGARRQCHDLLAKIVQFLQHGLVGGWFGKRRQFLDAGTTDLYHLTERVAAASKSRLITSPRNSSRSGSIWALYLRQIASACSMYSGLVSP